MRRAVLLGAVTAVLVVAAAGAVAVIEPAAHAPAPGRVHITRLFIPAIKADCRAQAGIPPESRIGYTFTLDGALVTIDRDGRLTGIDPERLDAFNQCLAQYPIEPIRLPPRDHYGRNLLYDYYATSLQPCLAGRVDALPPLPSRADFVVRLFSWDPYRFLAPGRGLDELLELAAACPALPPYLDAA